MRIFNEVLGTIGLPNEIQIFFSMLHDSLVGIVLVDGRVNLEPAGELVEQATFIFR